MKSRATEKLTEILETGIDVHRCAAARALGSINLPQSSDVLVRALLDEDPDVRVDAAIALGQIADPSTAEKLMDNLIGDPDADVKKVVLKALVAMRHEPVVKYLRLLAVSRAEEHVAWDENEYFQSGWDDWVDIQLLAVEGLSAFALEDTVSEINTVLNDEEGQDISEPCFRALSRMGETGAGALIDHFAIGNNRMRRRIARIVLESDNTHLDALKAGMIEDSSAVIREIALRSLDVSDDRLKPLFSDENDTVRAAVVTHAGAQNVPLLWDMIKDPTDAVRAEVFKVIAASPKQFRDKELAKAVQEAIAGEPKAAKQAALALVALRGPKAAKGLTHVLDKTEIPLEFRLGVIEALQKGGEFTVPGLLEAVKNPDRQLRLATMTALAQLAADDDTWPNEAGTGLFAALRGELIEAPEEEPEVEEIVEEVPISEEMEQEIADSLPLVAEENKPTSTLEAIMSNKPDTPQEEPEEIVLNDQDEVFLKMTKNRKFSKPKISIFTSVAPYLDVKRFAARLMGGIVREDVTDALIEALDTDDAELREVLLFSLAKHGEAVGSLPETALEPLQALLENTSSETQVLAARAYGWLTDDTVVDRLKDLLESNEDLVRVEAVTALDHRGVAGQEIVDALSDKYVGVGIAAARAIARLNGNDGVGPLIEFAVSNDGTYRRDIGRLLGQYAPDAGVDGLLKLLSDEDRKAQWLVAIDALAELFTQEKPTEALKAA